MKLRTVALAATVAGSVALSAGASRAADPTTADCLGASDASLKLGNQHKLRAERSQLLVCAAATCPADIRKECLARVDDVNAQIPTVVFLAKDGAGADLAAVRVTMDGETLAERLEGTALSIDPGEHTFTFETSGQPSVTKKIIVVEGQKDRRELVTFGVPAEAAATGSTTGPSVPPPETSEGIGTQKVLALVAGGVAVVGLGVGAAMGLVAMSKKSAAQSACPNDCATQDGVDKWSSASSAGTLSTIGFIVGGVGLAGAAVLWFTAPTAGAQPPQVGVGPGGLLLRGAW
ncbi:MAG TPA: hypothetical protein VGG39_16715 [Polyangiaceae bacterium]|jgi:hypothetical protein